MPSISGFHHTAIRSHNFDASIRFYNDVLGLKTKVTWGTSPNRAAMVDVGDGNYVEIFERDEAAPVIEATILHFALRTDDCAAMTEIVRASGAEITMEPKEVTIDSNVGPVPVKISFFRGPDNEIVELFENSLL